MTHHFACHDCPIELVTEVGRFAEDLANAHEDEDGHDVSVAEVA